MPLCDHARSRTGILKRSRQRRAGGTGSWTLACAGASRLHLPAQHTGGSSLMTWCLIRYPAGIFYWISDHMVWVHGWPVDPCVAGYTLCCDYKLSWTSPAGCMPVVHTSEHSLTLPWLTCPECALCGCRPLTARLPPTLTHACVSVAGRSVLPKAACTMMTCGLEHTSGCATCQSGCCQALALKRSATRHLAGAGQ